MGFNYRVIERPKKHFIEFFQKLFDLYDKGKLTFDDAYYTISFGDTPKCVSLDNYDETYHPVVLVGVTGGTTRDISINKFKDYHTDPDSGLVNDIYGGIATTTLNFQIRARNEDERNNLADIVSMYLNSQETKLAFLNTYGVRLIGAPTFAGESVEDDPQSNVKLFITDLTQVAESDYEEGVDIVDTLGNTGLTVQDIISYNEDEFPS